MLGNNIDQSKNSKMKTKPIKRHKALQNFSREHHHGLLLCWKIRTGVSKGISQERIKKYVDWFFEQHLVPHFTEEEKYIFSVLGNQHGLIKRALAEHRRLTRLFTDTKNITRSLHRIEEELEQHIRFEERVLFNEIQQVATEQQLKTILKLHTDGKFNDNESDKFWE